MYLLCPTPDPRSQTQKQSSGHRGSMCPPQCGEQPPVCKTYREPRNVVNDTRGDAGRKRNTQPTDSPMNKLPGKRKGKHTKQNFRVLSTKCLDSDLKEATV